MRPKDIETIHELLEKDYTIYADPYFSVSFGTVFAFEKQ
jgi:hypothetical protein